MNKSTNHELLASPFKILACCRESLNEALLIVVLQHVAFLFGFCPFILTPPCVAPFIMYLAQVLRVASLKEQLSCDKSRHRLLRKGSLSRQTMSRPTRQTLGIALGPQCVHSVQYHPFDLLRIPDRVDDEFLATRARGARGEFRARDFASREADRQVVRVQRGLHRVLHTRQICRRILPRL